jgi:serine phosphatase RsbU (regulator of sigma subunit)
MKDSLSFATGTHVHLNGRANNTLNALRDNYVEPRLFRFLQASLPPMLPAVKGLQFEALYLPCADGIIGGDWYDAFALPDGSVAVTVGDVTGHGVEEAVIMGKIRYSLRVVTLRTNALQTGGAASILPSVEAALSSEHPEASATAFLGIISPDRRSMQYATAGHPPPLVVTSSCETAWLEAGDAPLGCGNLYARSNHVIDLTGVWGLILYTDGVIEAGRDILQGLERLRKALQDPGMQTAKNLLPRIVEASLAAPPHDDIAMLAVTFA